MSLGRHLHDLFLWVRVDEAEVLLELGIRRLELKVGGDVATQFEVVRVMVFVEHILQTLQILSLLRRVSLLVGGSTSEWQSVVRVLGMFLMENIVFAVVPVGEASMV